MELNHSQSELLHDIRERPDELRNLLDQSFNVPRGHHYFDDFPVWNPRFKESSGADLVGVFMKGHLAACAGLRVCDVATLNKTVVRLGLIGAVATEPLFRGQGLATQLVQECLGRARAGGASWAVLWSGEREFYKNLGFSGFGIQTRIVLEDLELPQIPQKDLEPVYEGWTPALYGLIQARSSGLKLRDADRTWYTAHQNVQWFFTGKPESPTAYAAIGRGIDLKGHIHEWGGAPRGVLQILTYLKSQLSNLVLLGHPDVLKYFLGEQVTRFPVEEMCLAKSLQDPWDDSVADPKAGNSIWIWGLDAA